MCGQAGDTFSTVCGGGREGRGPAAGVECTAAAENCTHANSGGPWKKVSVGDRENKTITKQNDPQVYL